MQADTLPFVTFSLFSFFRFFGNFGFASKINFSLLSSSDIFFEISMRLFALVTSTVLLFSRILKSHFKVKVGGGELKNSSAGPDCRTESPPSGADATMSQSNDGSVTWTRWIIFRNLFIFRTQFFVIFIKI